MEREQQQQGTAGSRASPQAGGADLATPGALVGGRRGVLGGVAGPGVLGGADHGCVWRGGLARRSRVLTWLALETGRGLAFLDPASEPCTPTT
ncbi:hypothetical protein F751_1742 [Auxenochlorella protothecoides]|uniref:Uncharacterized protein n=1 Tax=Auxenochlorella protothecoides TaxID=3075 RepID=A0A087SGK9_AUXPR|nr:hypothetical protein F751_1742 [Auxenochlorella protothecoides]KFM24863.1 hypothetical protein F751_1742 [Auxenochlorella protothecoides]